ncbi:MAG: eukaryotic-like serine/threonine-protein kinase [Betaproteobacteria bacterium]
MTSDARKLGRYEIIAELGKGAMGTVYKAVDPLLNRTVALKTISVSPNDPEMAEYKARLFQEAKAVGGLNHPNIVTVYDVGDSGDLPYLAMEFLEGQELATLTAKHGALPVDYALDIAAQVAEGLAYAHEHGVFHRDIKPANIMIVHGRLAKIADFGIARMRTTQRTDGPPALGSPRYMSPEQVLGKRADHRSDIFSLGVVLYEMVTGTSPFAGGDLNAILFQIVNLVPPAPSTITPGTSATLDAILAKALAKMPEERYATAKDLADELKHCRTRLDADPRSGAVATSGQPALAKIDGYAVTPLLSKSYPQAREGDAQASTLGTATLGLAKDFDSLAAMARLASQTGVAQSFEGFVKAQTAEAEAEKTDAPTVHGKIVREQSSHLVSAGVKWNRSDQLIFTASIATAAVVAAFIVLA